MQYGKDTLRPVTIKQLLDAQLPHPDAENFKIDDTEIGQVSKPKLTTLATWPTDDGVDHICWPDPEHIESDNQHHVQVRRRNGNGRGEAMGGL